MAFKSLSLSLSMRVGGQRCEMKVKVVVTSYWPGGGRIQFEFPYTVLVIGKLQKREKAAKTMLQKLLKPLYELGWWQRNGHTLWLHHTLFLTKLGSLVLTWHTNAGFSCSFGSNWHIRERSFCIFWTAAPFASPKVLLRRHYFFRDNFRDWTMSKIFALGWRGGKKSAWIDFHWQNRIFFLLSFSSSLFYLGGSRKTISHELLSSFSFERGSKPIDSISTLCSFIISGT